MTIIIPLFLNHSALASVTVFSSPLSLPLRLGHMLWGNCSTADHGVNLLLHALVTLLYAHTLLHALRLTPLQVLLSGLTFATHPVHTEAVGSDVAAEREGRGADMLMGELCLLSIILFCG